MADFNKYIKYMTREPKSVEGLNNTSYFYYYDKLMKMIYTIFKFDNVPPYWNMPYFKEKLFNRGVLAVVDTSAGVLPLECSYDGINIWGMPVYFNINNVVLGNLRGKIGEDGELIYFSVVENTYKSMVQLVDRYASLLANIDGSLNTTLINSRMAQVFEASSNSQLKVMEKVYDQISNGKPAVFVRKNGEEPFEHAIFNNVKNTYQTGSITGDAQKYISNATNALNSLLQADNKLVQMGQNSVIGNGSQRQVVMQALNVLKNITGRFGARQSAWSK